MTELFENWRDYQETQEANQFVQDIWEGKFLEGSPVIYEANGVWHLDSRLDEGLWDFMKSVVSWGKSKYAEFEDWAESKLQKVVDAALEKLQSFLSKGREITKNAEGKMKSFLMKLFNKNQYRRIRDVLGALRQPQWLAVGATLLSMLLQKVAKMGMNRLLDAASGGSATAARVINFIRENYERFQEFMEMIMNFLDPNGLLDTIENLGIFKDTIEKFQQLKKDIRSQAFKENIMENLLETLTDEELTEIVRSALIESGKCQKGYKTHPTRKTKEMFGKQYRNCVPADEALRDRVRQTIEQRLSEDDGETKKDACYYKVKDRYKVFPSAYASGALVQCRDKGAANWGNSDKKNETKEDFEPHMMYDPETGEEVEAKTHQDHIDLGKKGYVHEKPDSKNELRDAVRETILAYLEEADFELEKDRGLKGWFDRQGAKGSTGGWIDCKTCRKDKKTGRKKCSACAQGDRKEKPYCRPKPSDCGKKK